jgi:hypothetical protein
VLGELQERISTVGVAALLGSLSTEDEIDAEIMLRISERLGEINDDLILATKALSV